MSTIVKFFCDRCKENKSANELIRITISMHHLGNGIKVTPSYCGVFVDWCCTCCRAMGIDPTQKVLEEPPTPTMESMIKDLVQSSVEDAIAAKRS